MTTDNKRAILEAAAKACGIDGIWQEGYGVFIKGNYMLNPGEEPKFFNPIDNPLDTASMCAKLEISTLWLESSVDCDVWLGPKVKRPHDGTIASKEAAWRLAASMVAAKVGGYEDA